MNNGRGFAVAKLCAEKPERCDGFGFAGYSTRALFLCANNAKAKVFAGNSTVYLEPDDAVFIAPFESYAVNKQQAPVHFTVLNCLSTLLQMILIRNFCSLAFCRQL